MDNDFQLDEEDEDLEEEEEEEESPPGDPPEQTPEQKQIADLTAQLTELKNRPQTSPELAQLVELGKQFLSKQTSTPAPENKEQIATFGKSLQDAIISGKPEDAARLLVETADNIAKQRINEALATSGRPIAERTGDFAVQMFLASKAEDLGPNAEKMHKLIAKDFKLDDEERAWVATASAENTSKFLEKKYREAAGDVLIRSSKNAKPKDLGGGGSGGGKGGATVTTLPGVNAREMKKQMQLAEQYWPDPVERAKKLKEIAGRMEQGA